MGAVEIRQKPKPPPYTPPESKADDSAAEEEVTSAPEPDASSSSSAPEGSEPEDPAGELFVDKKNELEAKKKQATADEDYDLAQEIKDEIVSLSRKEKERLESLKK